jgi:predicted RNA polymerase sigma factor
VLEEVFRDEWGRVLASLVGFLGDFDRAEDAAQEAFAIAAERWPASGVPPNPGGWLVTTARNRAIDRIRRERTLAGKIRLLPAPEAVMDEFDDTASTWTATCTSTPPAASCCAVSAATPRPGRRTAGPWSWPPRPPNGGS